MMNSLFLYVCFYKYEGYENATKEKKKGGKDRQEQEESKKPVWNITDFILFH